MPFMLTTCGLLQLFVNFIFLRIWISNLIASLCHYDLGSINHWNKTNKLPSLIFEWLFQSLDLYIYIYEMYPHLINKINNRHRTSVVPNSNGCWLDFGVSISKPNYNIKTHLTFKPITHLIGFWFFIKI
jgi:hypothetical protein